MKRFKFSYQLLAAILFSGLFMLGASGVVSAQLLKLPSQAAPVGPPAPRDILGRETPKGMIQGFLKSVGSESYDRAALYLDLSKIPAARQKIEGPALTRDLQRLLDQGGWVANTSNLSDAPEGSQDDGLAPEIDRVGTIKAGEKSVDLLAEKYTDPVAGPIWRISSETVMRIPALLEEMAVGPLDSILPKVLIENKLHGVPLGHWVAIVVLAVLSLMASWLLTFGVIAFIRYMWRVTRTGYAEHVVRVFELPIRVYLAVGVFAVLVRVSGISIVARQDFELIAGIIAWLSLAWLLWRIIDIITESAQARMTREKKRSALSAIVFFRRSARFILAAVAVAIALDHMGLNVTAGVAALGLGGLALAFGARQTLEHFMGSLTLIVEQPVRIGDFCKVGAIMGTVEDIGMRSTRLFTQDRTVVTIPNGTFASMTIENYTLRDRFLFHPVLALRYDTTTEKIEDLLAKMRSLLSTHPRIDSDPARVRFTGFGSDGLNIDVFAYIYATHNDDFLAVQEEILLKLMKIVEENGAVLLPSAAKS